MYSRGKILEPYVAGTLYQAVTIYHAGISILHADRFCDLHDAYAGYMAFTDDQKTQVGNFGCIPSWWLVSYL